MLIIIVVSCFFISPISRIALLGAAAILAAWEMCNALEHQELKCCRWILYVYAAAEAALIYFEADTIISEALFFACIFAILFAGIVSQDIKGKGAVSSLAVLVYPLVPFIFIMRFAMLKDNLWVPVFAIGCISTWCCDAFALFGGMLFGKHKCAPHVSPNKTIEGCVTGAVFAVIAGVILYFCLRANYNVSLFVCALTAFICSTFGQIGDLAASLIKRMVDIKDYSNLIPGHGGVVDRTDSLMFSIPAAYFCLAIAGVL